MKYNVLVFDTETNDKAKNMKISAEDDLNNYPNLLQLGFSLFKLTLNTTGKIIKTKTIYEYSGLIKPERIRNDKKEIINISEGAIKVHGLTFDKLEKEGVNYLDVLMLFQGVIAVSDIVVAHNMNFDRNVIVSEFLNEGITLKKFKKTKTLCTMNLTTPILKLPNKFNNSNYKWPKLEELYKYLFNKKFDNAHDAFYDVKATEECFIELIKRGLIKIN